MTRGSLAGLPSVVREAIDPGAGWQEVPWVHQGNRHFQIGDGLHLKLRREGMPGARMAAEAERLRWLSGRFGTPGLAAYATDGTVKYLLMTVAYVTGRVPGR